MPLILTRLAVDPGRMGEWDAYRVHQRIAALFDGLDCRPLWQRPTPGLLLIQGPFPVVADMFPAGFVLAAETVDVEEMLAGLECGQRVRVTTVVNPTRATSTPAAADGTRPRGKRAPIPARDRDGWLADYLGRALLTDQIAGRDMGVSVAVRPAGAPVRTLWHGFTMSARIVDVELLARLVETGIGHGRAFGCGLLAVEPGEKPVVAVADRRCPACAGRIIEVGEVECSRCHVGVAADGTLAGFTRAAVEFWRRQADHLCVDKYGFPSWAKADATKRKTETRSPWSGAGEAQVWHCEICDLWHWGHGRPGDVRPQPAVGDILRPYATEARSRKWWRMGDGRVLDADFARARLAERDAR